MFDVFESLKIYNKKKKKKKKTRVGRVVLDQTFHPILYGSSKQIFMLDTFEYSFIQHLAFHHCVECKTLCNGVYFERFYWHSNVNNLWRAAKNKRGRRSQTRQERRSKNGEWQWKWKRPNKSRRDLSNTFNRKERETEKEEKDSNSKKTGSIFLLSSVVIFVIGVHQLIQLIQH